MFRRFIESEPLGYVDQPAFVNLAACIWTSNTPDELLKMLKEVEAKAGRIHRERWHERELDIDIIFYGDSILKTDKLVIPHPDAHLRKFVLEPLTRSRRILCTRPKGRDLASFSKIARIIPGLSG